ncbi:hypothetical protein [Peribacillus loiseleuriae]|uniref:Uncharacterized protein n=1 Tax=Peribacillus loiseleuriae TaxID=1679170 RepID=A0A0K9GWN2_9BACI|nr:hypothetical protein [Peribacillus loiseleuriae]KMY51033.1 hypothetical protein AC625_17110 [Peribacillus loiseleuriae]
MEWALLITSVISILGISVLYFQILLLKKDTPQKIMNDIIQIQEINTKKIKELINGNNQFFEEEISKFSEELEQHTKQLFTDNIISQKSSFNDLLVKYQSEFKSIERNIMQNIVERLDETQEEITSKLDFYINEELNEIDKWIHAIKKYKNSPAKCVAMLESALNKYPSSKHLMNLYKENILFLIDSKSPVIKRQAIERYNRTTRVYLDNCRVEDWEFAEEIKNHSLKLGNQYMNDIESKRLSKIKETIEELQIKVSKLTYRKNLTDEEINEIEQLDNQVDKAFIANYPDLNDRYNEVSKMLIQYFSTVENDESRIKEYNLNAIDSIQIAYNDFQNNDKSYKKGENIHKLVSKLGGWDSKYLYSSTQIYFQSAYSEIFSKLDLNVKPTFTEKMVNEQIKGIG